MPQQRAQNNAGPLIEAGLLALPRTGDVQGEFVTQPGQPTLDLCGITGIPQERPAQRPGRPDRQICSRLTPIAVSDTLVSDDQSRMTVPNVEIRPKTRIRTRSLSEAGVVRQQSRRAGIVLGPTTGRAPAPVFHPRRDGCIQPRPIGTALAAGNDAVDATHSAVRPTGVDLHGGMLAPSRCAGAG